MIGRYLLVVLLVIHFTNVHSADTIQWFQTSEGNHDRITPQKPIVMNTTPLPTTPNRIEVTTKITYQTIIGFGGAFTEASSVLFGLLNDTLQNEILNAYWGEGGNNYTMGRVPIGSCDYAIDSYNFDYQPGDYTMKYFDISHDLVEMVPFMQKAMSINEKFNGGTVSTPINLFGSAWSPPAWMKANGQMDKTPTSGGLIDDPKIWKAFALYYVKFIQEYEKNGVPLWGLTAQNEPLSIVPWEACWFNSTQQRIFLQDFLLPALESAGLVSPTGPSKLKVMVYDDQKSSVAYEYIGDVYANLTTQHLNEIWGSSWHWYSGPQFDVMEGIHELYPQFHILATEACDCFPPNSKLPLPYWYSGEHYGSDILGDLNAWAEGWVHWNLMLDEWGGPNHDNETCDAPIIITGVNYFDNGTVDYSNSSLGIYYQPSYYYMGHFSRFIPPQSVRIGWVSNVPQLQVTSFLRPDNLIATVILNTSDQPESFTYVNIDTGEWASMTINAHTIQTLLHSSV
eukprot:TRINITY_DN3491_c0_g1_i1.p1 TRINITY_DN3491_c0_g1~~TRINITY_DN3491_c0_g1_i1.p1  ORF type:complete len:510 (+),score=97.18 TRINITY_DN3491_c0_g1_i1:112-1641(+)